MKNNKKALKNPVSRGNQVMPLNTPIAEDARRDPKTNVYIPNDAEVLEAKEWVDFCKL